MSAFALYRVWFLSAENELIRQFSGQIMSNRKSLGKAIRMVRCLQQKTQEDLSASISRTYLSCLENGQKSPTVDKLEQIACALNIHPVSLILISYLLSNSEDKEKSISEVIEQTTRVITMLGL